MSEHDDLELLELTRVQTQRRHRKRTLKQQIHQRLRVLQTVQLRGSFAFDALSPDARTLYLIEHVSQRDLSRYVVRALDLGTNRLSGPIVDQARRRVPDERLPRHSRDHRNGRWVYTLYRNGRSHPFIHALDATNRQAICIDLP